MDSTPSEFRAFAVAGSDEVERELGRHMRCRNTGPGKFNTPAPYPIWKEAPVSLSARHKKNFAMALKLRFFSSSFSFFVRRHNQILITLPVLLESSSLPWISSVSYATDRQNCSRLPRQSNPPSLGVFVCFPLRENLVTWVVAWRSDILSFPYRSLAI